MDDFNELYEDLLNEISQRKNVDVVKSTMHFTGEFSVDNISYEYEFKYHPKIVAGEVLFKNKTKDSYSRTNDIKHANRVFGFVFGGVYNTLEKIKGDTNYLPDHIFFRCDNKDAGRISLYDKIMKSRNITDIISKFNYFYDESYNNTISNYIKDDPKKGNFKIYNFTLKK